MLVMIKEIDESAYFQIALKYLIHERGHGYQTALAIDTGLEGGFVSQLKTGKRQASAKTQIKIAKALGYGYIEFLSLGRNLLTGKGETPQAQTASEELILLRKYVVYLEEEIKRLKEPWSGEERRVANLP